MNEEEIGELNRVVTMYLDYAEDQARRHMPMYTKDWIEKLDAFLQFNERSILTHAGTISRLLAEERAYAEFEKYEAQRRQLEASQPTSDFDKAVEQVKRLKQESEETKPK
ncbi:MAG: RhuM family protein [bacterium]